jgi:MerR family redox-sensitive transcriptional activator SoxR
MDDGTLTIGQVAKRAGLNLSAIRYYEEKGLLPDAPRVSGQRRYTEDTLARLGVIDVAKRAGFSLEDIRVLLDTSDAGQPAHQQLQDLARRKLPEVEELIARAQRVHWLAPDRHRLRLQHPRRLRTVLAGRPPPTGRSSCRHGEADTVRLTRPAGAGGARSSAPAVHPPCGRTHQRADQYARSRIDRRPKRRLSARPLHKDLEHSDRARPTLLLAPANAAARA